LKYQATFHKIFKDDDEENSPYQLKEQKSLLKGKPMVINRKKVEIVEPATERRGTSSGKRVVVRVKVPCVSPKT
jgi:hypothetical protein